MHNKTEPSQTMAPETCSASNFGPEISVVDLTGAFHLETRSDQQGCFARSFPSTYCVSHDNSLTPEDRRPPDSRRPWSFGWSAGPRLEPGLSQALNTVTFLIRTWSRDIWLLLVGERTMGPIGMGSTDLFKQ
ncbi:hypothetical protein E5D57_001426 [Metarhizium anisopliae]|nr:hypothetical protein E5D57_001426 [Metarhizium anisopliae]